MKDEFSGLALREGGFMTFSLPGSSGDVNKTTIEIHNSFNKGKRIRLESRIILRLPLHPWTGPLPGLRRAEHEDYPGGRSDGRY